MSTEEDEARMNAENKVLRPLYMVLFGDNSGRDWAFYLPYSSGEIDCGQIIYLDGKQIETEHSVRWQSKLFHQRIILKAAGEDVEPREQALWPVNIDEEEETFLARISSIKVSFDRLWEAAVAVFAEAKRPGYWPTKRYFCLDVAEWLEERNPGSIGPANMEIILHPASHRQLPGMVRRNFSFDDSECPTRWHDVDW